LSGTGDFLQYWNPASIPNQSQIYGVLDSQFSEALTHFPTPLRQTLSRPSWLAQTETIPTTLVNGAAHRAGVRLTGDENYLSRIHIVQGSAPAVWTGNDADPPTAVPPAPIQILLSVSAAHSLKITIGDVLGSGVVDGITGPGYQVTGLFQPRDASALYWAENPSLIPASLVKPSLGPSYLEGSAYLNPVSVGRLSQTFATAGMSVYYPMSATATDGADADALLAQVAAVISTGLRMAGDGSTPLSMTSGTPGAIVTAIQRDSLMAGFLALLASAPLGVTLAVLGLGVDAVVAARRRDIALAVARGADAFRVRAALALEGLVLTWPGALVATAIVAFAIPVRPELSGFVLPVLVAVAPVVLFAVLPVTSEAGSSRRRATIQLRGIVETAVVLLALLALVLLERRGLAQSSTDVGIDPLLVAAPLLLSVSVGILVLRGYPVPLQAARIRAARSRGLAAFVGSIRATRAPTVGLVGVLALVVGISIAIFSTVMLTTFDGAIRTAAAQTVGADVRADAPSFDPAERSAVAAVPGVRDVAGVQHLDPRTLRGSGVIDTVGVLIGQTGSLRSLRPDLSANLSSTRDGRVPVIVSSDLADEVHGHANLTLDGVPIVVAGRLPADSELGPTRSWMLVDSAFASRFTATFAPDLLLLRTTQNSPSDLRNRVALAAGPRSIVSSVASVAAGRQSEPAVAAVRIALVLGAAISLLLSVLALVLSTIVASRARARTAGILRTFGLRSRQLRVLIAWELIPVGIIAVLAGAALGVVLPLLLTNAVDLRPFAGGTARPALLFDSLLLALVLGIFSAVIAVVGIIAAAAGERLNPSTALKMGVQ
jgi:putative ABC transport system permease protein